MHGLRTGDWRRNATIHDTPARCVFSVSASRGSSSRYLRLRQHLHLDAGGVSLVEDPFGGLSKILRLGVGNVGENLRITVGERELQRVSKIGFERARP
jgi:hypothetical protein